MSKPTAPTLYDRFKANVIKVNQLNAKTTQLRQQLEVITQAGNEVTGAINLLLELDPTLPEQFQKEQQAAQKKATEAPAKA